MDATISLGSISPHTVLAVTGVEGESEHVRRAALDLAKEHGARLIYYDSSSASSISEPVASEWSAEGEGRQFGDPLSEGDLEALGRRPLAVLVRAARNEGVEAWGWLASDHGLDAVMDYARRQGAGLVLVSASMEDPSLLDRLRGDTAGDAAEAGPVPVALVEEDGTLRLAG